MIVPSGRVQVFVATRPVDFRKGMDGLAALVERELGLDPFSGAIYVFRAKRGDRIKVLPPPNGHHRPLGCRCRRNRPIHPHGVSQLLRRCRT